MNLVTIASKSIRQRWLASSLTALSIALGVALMVAVLVINGVVTRMFNQNATGFQLILGAKGSPMQLVLNTIYFLDKPIENVPYKRYLEVKETKWVAHAIPFALGDTTEDGRFRIVGTFPEYFDLDYVPGKKFELQQGKFLSGTRDAVIGARVARAYGWKVGHQFPIAHGGNLTDIHDEKFTVVGVLAPTGLPTDRAVFIHYDGFYEIKGHGMTPQEAEAERQAARGANGDAAIMVPSVTPGSEPLPAGPAGERNKALSDEQKRVTAILVQTKGKGPAEQDAIAFLMKPLINKAPVFQAVNPIEQIRKLLEDVVGNIRTMLLVMTVLIIVVSGVGIFVSIYNSMADRKREIAIMRALGARRRTVFSIIIAEAVLLCGGGGLAGLFIGHVLVFLTGPIVEARSDILIDPWFFEPHELYILPALLVLAVIVGLVPGLTAYRADVAKGLSD
jgi:putative ABC transport system permease protein